MKILLVNYRYFVSGGPERYMFNVADALTRRGHDIVPFSIRYTRNLPTPYERYFVEPLGSRDEVTFGEQRATPRTMWRTMSRLFYARDVERAAALMVADTRPEVAYVLHYLRKLSPSLLVALKAARLPIVVRLSDYGMVCPEQHCLRNGVACELCVLGNLWPSIRYGCVQNSRTASGLNALATCYHRWRRYFDLIDAFVTTTEFMHRMMLCAGFPERRLRHIPTYVNGSVFKPRPGFAKDEYIAYAGALRGIKGVHVLLEAVCLLRRRRPDLNVRLKVAGVGDPHYSAQLRQQVEREGLRDAVEFLGRLPAAQLSDLLSGARLSVVPSLWYENLPNAVLESYACGTAVLASDLGSLPECVSNGETGYCFRAGDVGSLAKSIESCLDHPRELVAMARQAHHAAQTIYCPERHMAALEGLFAELAARHGPSRAPGQA